MTRPASSFTRTPVDESDGAPFRPTDGSWLPSPRFAPDDLDGSPQPAAFSFELEIRSRSARMLAD
jgi:hypothetical protein